MSFTTILYLSFGLQMVCALKLAKTSEELELYIEICEKVPLIPKKDIGIGTLKELLPIWNLNLVSDTDRLHFAQILRGKVLSSSSEEDYSGMCLQIRDDVGYVNSTGGEGTIFGFGNLHAYHRCKPSSKLEGVLSCVMKTDFPKEYYEDVNLFLNFLNKEETLLVVVMCFPKDKHVGWHAASDRIILSDDDIHAVNNYIYSLGFKAENTIPMYDALCVM